MKFILNSIRKTVILNLLAGLLCLSSSVIIFAADANPAALPIAPESPRIFQDNGLNTQEVLITWNSQTGIEKYQIWCGTSEADRSQYAVVHAAKKHNYYRFTTLTNDTTYHIWLKAIYTNGTSDFSPALTFTTPAHDTSMGE